MKTILFPTDFSQVSDNAFRYAIHLADKMDAWIILFHCHSYEQIHSTWIPEELVSALNEKNDQEIMEYIEKYHSTIQKEEGKTVTVVPKIVFGHPKEEILSLSREMEPDIVVMGTKGNHTLMNKLLGSITAEVINYANIPVLAIPEKVRFKGIQRIVYATNFEEENLAVFGQLKHFADLLEAQLACIHIRTGKGWDLLQLNFFNQLFRQKIDSKEIEFYLQSHESVVSGLAYFMTSKPGEILAMMTHKRDLFDQIFRKSLTKEMALQAEVPLLAFHNDSISHLVN